MMIDQLTTLWSKKRDITNTGPKLMKNVKNRHTWCARWCNDYNLDNNLWKRSMWKGVFRYQKMCSNFSKKCPWYAQTMTKICLIYAQHMPNICPGYALKCPRYAQHIPKICQRYPQIMPEISPKYSKEISQICPRYAPDMPKMCPMCWGILNKILCNIWQNFKNMN